MDWLQPVPAHAGRSLRRGARHRAVSSGAGDVLTAIAYTWSHPDDGAQEGLLVIGADGDAGAVSLWADSWHQKPDAMVLGGSRDDGQVFVSCEYGCDWQWTITVDATVADELHLRMDNVIPESATTADISAGAYAAMVTVLRRTT